MSWDLANRVLTACRNSDLSLATAESCTGGMLSSFLTAIPGSSDVVSCGFVTYSNDAKIRLLGVPSGTIAEFGAVSEPVALAMAKGALVQGQVDIAASVTGVAGPGGTENKPEGMVCFGVATKEVSRTTTCQFGPIGRDRVRMGSAVQALQMLLSIIEAEHQSPKK